MEQTLKEDEYWYVKNKNSDKQYLVKIVSHNQLFAIVKDVKADKYSFVSIDDSRLFTQVEFIKKWEPNWFWKKMGY
jgi:hypothetical protein